MHIEPTATRPGLAAIPTCGALEALNIRIQADQHAAFAGHGDRVFAIRAGWHAFELVRADALPRWPGTHFLDDFE